MKSEEQHRHRSMLVDHFTVADCESSPGFDVRGGGALRVQSIYIGNSAEKMEIIFKYLSTTVTSEMGFLNAI